MISRMRWARRQLKIHLERTSHDTNVSTQKERFLGHRLRRKERSQAEYSLEQLRNYEDNLR